MQIFINSVESLINPDYSAPPCRNHKSCCVRTGNSSEIRSLGTVNYNEEFSFDHGNVFTVLIHYIL